MADTSDASTTPVPSHSREFRLRRGRNWFFLGLLYASYYLCRYNLGIAAPELMDELDLSKPQYGQIQTGRDAGYAVGQFVNGLFADGIGGKQSMAIGALGTIVFNLAFGATSATGIAWMLVALIGLRTLDGYMQAFGAPGMVKINTSWFQRRERGKFAGIFGGMIQLGAIGVGFLGPILLLGFTIPFTGITTPGMNWRTMFAVPPAILFVVMVVAWFNVKNHPEEAGFSIAHDDDEHQHSPGAALPIRQVFRKIAGNPLAWINAGAYFSTGFVRRALEAWWVLYMLEAWSVGKSSGYFRFLVWALPISAFVGSFTSGWLSDTVFKGRRSPIATLLYGLETVCIIVGIFVLQWSSVVGPMTACIVLLVISLTCNSSHSIIGTAVAMDIGGRKMSGFACGVIDSFQYFGAMLAGFALGGWIEVHGWDALFWAMLPFSALGTLLMGGVWIVMGSRDVKGA